MNRLPENFEKLLHRALRDLPGHCSPRTLEARVLAEIARRAELPWWRKSHLHWPAATRGAFFILSATVAAMTVAGLFHFALGTEFAQWAGGLWRHFDWLRSLGADGGKTVADIGRAIPLLWLYGVLTALAACYAVLIGVAAAAYRTFFDRNRYFPS